MNLLEINLNKLKELTLSDFDRGLTNETVEKNRLEFLDGKKNSKKGVIFALKEIFSDVLPIVFLFLSALSAIFFSDIPTLVVALVFLTVSVFLKVKARSYSAAVYKTLNQYGSSLTAIREGSECLLEPSELVPGDILTLKFGDVLPCDAIVISHDSLKVSEMQLTGNVRPVIKMSQEDVIRGNGVPYYSCILFAGSVVAGGSAKVMVANVGQEVFDKKNKITSRSKHARRTKLFEAVRFISKQASLIWILFTFVAFFAGLFKGFDGFSVLYLAITLAVSALPDTIFTFFDLTLTSLFKELNGKGCTVRDTSVIDRMCDISCIAVDDSRYFRTENPRPSTVYVNDEKKKFKAASEPDVRELFELALSASVSGDTALKYNGRSIEESLILYGEEIGISQQSLREKYLLLEKAPITRDNPTSRVILFKDREFFIVSLGTPSAILRSCSTIEKNGETLVLDEVARKAIRELSKTIASANEGVIALAVKKIEYKEGSGQIESRSGYSFKGFIGFHTPIKPDAARAVHQAREAGIDVALMSSEGYSTSRGLAKSISILKEGDKSIEGKELPEIDKERYKSEIADYKVLVSFTPSQKTGVVRLRKESGDIVASTVSDISDFSRLLESDVSFCPSDTSRSEIMQNSDVVINGGFELIPECIKYARAVYRNIRHMLEYFVTSQLSLVLTLVISAGSLGSLVLTPAALLAYSALAVLPALFALSAEKVRENELKEGFGAQNLGVNLHNVLFIPTVTALTSAAVTSVTAKAAAVAGLLPTAVSGVSFMTLTLSAVFTAWAVSADVFDSKVFKNKKLIIAGAFTLVATAVLFIKPFIIGVALASPKVTLLGVALSLAPAVVCTGVHAANKFVFQKK